MSASHSSGFWPVVAAFVGNRTVCVGKFAGFLVSGSSAMFSEAVHSFADTANQSLLLIGLKRSRLAPSLISLRTWARALHLGLNFSLWHLFCGRRRHGLSWY